MTKSIKDLIPVQNNDKGIQVVSGRDLHDFLGVKAQYTDWLKRMINYGFVENVDFTVIHKNVKDDTAFGGVRKLKDIAMILDMAKEVSMIQRTPQGKQARQYFINVEKAYRSQQQRPMTLDDKLAAIAQSNIETKKAIDQNTKDIQDLKENQTINPGEYSYLNRLVSKKVYEYAKNSTINFTKKQIGELFKDISNGIKQVSNIKTRSQIRAGQYNDVIDYVCAWIPSVATVQVVKNMDLDLGDEK
jgi:anti-repressor protein